MREADVRVEIVRGYYVTILHLDSWIKENSTSYGYGAVVEFSEILFFMSSS